MNLNPVFHTDSPSLLIFLKINFHTDKEADKCDALRCRQSKKGKWAVPRSPNELSFGLNNFPAANCECLLFKLPTNGVQHFARALTKLNISSMHQAFI